MRSFVLFLSAIHALAAAEAPVYLTLWFDTEDYVDPASDDAAMRIAQDLERLGVRATFKIVGEKARVLEQRNRRDVIRALLYHDIGYHAENHSIQPAPAVYLRDLGWFEGAQEFERREGQGVRDIQRIFGVTPSCYGQPGSSWGPQSYRALLRMGIPVYLDDGSHVRVDNQAFWMGGMLHVFGMGPNTFRPFVKDKDTFEQTMERFDRAVADLRARGGGMISSYYHPTEFVNTEFWDGVNFPKGSSRERADWQKPKPRTAEEAERCYRILTQYVEHAKKAGVKFVTAREFSQIYGTLVPSRVPREVAVKQLADRITFNGQYSAADLLLALLGLKPQRVEGPTQRAETTVKAETIARPAFLRAKVDAAAFIEKHHRLPAEVWIGAEKLSLKDFAATVAGDEGFSGPVRVRNGVLEMEKYVATDSTKAFNWAIHPEGFSAPNLHELARLQAWTLKPAALR